MSVTAKVLISIKHTFTYMYVSTKRRDSQRNLNKKQNHILIVSGLKSMTMNFKYHSVVL